MVSQQQQQQPFNGRLSVNIFLPHRLTFSTYHNLGFIHIAMVSQRTKYEVSRFTRYEAINGSAKCSGVVWGG